MSTVKVPYWDPDQNKEVEVVTDLESIIRNPSGYKMDFVGLLLFNKERRALGLSEYKRNPVTGTFDEIKDEEEE